MFFFTEIQKLLTQLIGDSYGPVNTDTTNKYNITSKFDLNDVAKVFACVNANMIVQQSVIDDSLVNLILKPCSELKVPIDVDYYVYRGVLKSSLLDLNGQNIAQFIDSISNDLIKRIHASQPSDLSCGTLGYDNNDIDGSVNIADIFDCLLYPNIDSILVKEGEWIGTFSNNHKIGFEVILKTNRFKVDLNYVRKGEHIVDVTGLSGFNEKIKREEILNFLDPAALFGSHFYKKVDFYGDEQNKKLTTTTTPGDNFIYTKLIEKFYSKNRLYLDIRSEKGYSYNFYENYKVSNTDPNNIQIRHQSGSDTLDPQRYQINNWPIVFVESEHESGNTNILRLKLRIDDNTKPILYFAKEAKGEIKVTENNSDYFKTDTLIKNGNTYLTDWTKEFLLKIPNTQSGNSRNYICNYVKMNYFRALYNETLPDKVLKNQYYYDSAFCSVDIPDIGNPNVNSKEVKSADPVYVREPNNDNGTGNFQLNMDNGAYWNDNRILFYSTLEYRSATIIQKNNQDEIHMDFVSEKEFLNTYSQKLDMNTLDYDNSQLKYRTEIICREYEIEDNNIIRIPGINFYKSKDLGRINYTKNYKECAMLLGLTVDELNSIKNDTQLDNRHQRFIHLERDADNPLTTIPDTANNNTTYRYYRYTVQLQGLDSSGNRTIVTPQHNSAPIIVYSRDNQFFSSADFSADEPLTTGQNGQNQINRVEFHIYHDGKVKINDNIDFALIQGNQTAGSQNIFYFYHDANDVITNIHDSGLELVMANKMKRDPTKFTAMDNAYNILVKNYANDGVPGVDADYTNRNDNGDLMTVPYTQKAKNDYKYRKYLNQKKKVFMVKFVTQINTNPSNIIFTNTNLGINVEFRNTLRLYGNPDLVAAVLGALVQFNGQIICQGLAYEDASCYPSKEHVNGEALDTDYLSTTITRPDPDRDVDFILALSDFGFKIFRIASTNYSFATNIYNNVRLNPIITKLSRDSATDLYQLHSGHLHSTTLVINDGEKTL
jgi:hypothetical protein